METILLEKIKKLGDVGDLVTVKDGYARNYLLPKNKVLRATKENKEKFEAQRDLIRKNNADKKEIALRNFKKINGKTFSVIRQASDDRKLYGSVTNKDIANILASSSNINVPVENVILYNKIKDTGLHSIGVELHADVEAKIKIIVARSEEEAKGVLEKEKPKDQKEVENKNNEGKVLSENDKEKNSQKKN